MAYPHGTRVRIIKPNNNKLVNLEGTIVQYKDFPNCILLDACPYGGDGKPCEHSLSTGWCTWGFLDMDLLVISITNGHEDRYKSLLEEL